MDLGVFSRQSGRALALRYNIHCPLKEREAALSQRARIRISRVFVSSKSFSTQLELLGFTLSVLLSFGRCRRSGPGAWSKGHRRIPAGSPVRKASPVGFIGELHLGGAVKSAKLWGEA